MYELYLIVGSYSGAQRAFLEEFGRDEIEGPSAKTIKNVVAKVQATGLIQTQPIGVWATPNGITYPGSQDGEIGIGKGTDEDEDLRYDEYPLRY
jgi:hypothetical protein